MGQPGGGQWVGALNKQSTLVIRTIQGYMFAQGKSTALNTYI